MLEAVGIVVIGRNEGERLAECFHSVLGKMRPIVYVDSNSTDDSLQIAQTCHIDAVSLDNTSPFTAARARNMGFHYLMKNFSHLHFVQFLDGDCVLQDGWLEAATQFLASTPSCAVACGQLTEKDATASVYHLLCDMEWKAAAKEGEIKGCGGVALMRARAFQQVDGFNESLIAGEEPELCLRLRQEGWTIHALNTKMAIHDARMSRFYQWWKRNMRAGHAYAEGAWLHPKKKYRLKETLSNWFWGLILPLMILASFGWTRGFSLLLAGGYFVLAYKIFHRSRRQGAVTPHAFFYAVFCVMGKFAQAFGQLSFFSNKLLRKKTMMIEYKEQISRS